MRRWLFFPVLLGFTGSGNAQEWQPPVPLEKLASAAETALLPFPKEFQRGIGEWKPAGEIRIARAGNAEDFSTAIQRTREIFRSEKITVKETENSLAIPSEIRLRIDKAAGKPEGYELIVESGGVSLTGADPAGLYHGLGTLAQLRRGDGTVPCVRIKDWPAFSVRGFMHDTGRNFQPVAELKRQIDIASRYKVNVFHWHLTDYPAWRVESRKFPQLNDPKFRTAGRGETDGYSFAEIRDVIAFAKARHVRVIPELDMPGHSTYFTRAFGFPMSDPRGMEILERLLEEFCAEIPVADCPWLHIGSDEVRIKNPGAFMSKMAAKLRSLGRTPIIWNPGLPNDGTMISQAWSDDGANQPKHAKHAGIIDSSLGYANLYDPSLIVRRYYYGQPCHAAVGDSRSLGVIYCIWPDIRVDDKKNILSHNPVWPGLLSMAECAWVGRPSRNSGAMSVLSAPDSVMGKSFAEFETRLTAVRDRDFSGEPFPYFRQSHVSWSIAGPFPMKDGQPAPGAGAAFSAGKTTTAQGGTVLLADPDGKQGIFAGKKSPGVAYALTYAWTEKPREIRALVGFEAVARSNRRSGGIPPAGQWDGFGAEVLINGTPLSPPQWKQPGKFRFLEATWEKPPNEIPITNEELWWKREPAVISLNAGWNQILLKVPCGYAGQNWTFTFIPVKPSAGGAWTGDDSVRFSATRE